MNYKNIKIYFVLLAALVFMFACVDESKSPLPKVEPSSGATVTFGKILSPLYDFSKIQSSFYEAELNDYSGKIKSYSLNVSWKNASGTSDTVFVKKVEAFPSKLKVTIQELAKALKVKVDTFKGGDKFNFLAAATDGKFTWGYNTENINDDLLSSGQKLAYNFPVYVACPSSYDGLKVDFEVLSWNGGSLDKLGASNTKGELVWNQASTPFTYRLSVPITFGAYGALFGCCDDGANNSTELFDVCNNLSISPKDQFNGAWNLKVKSVNGSEMVIILSGQYAGNIEVKMKRKDGQKWAFNVSS